MKRVGLDIDLGDGDAVAPLALRFGIVNEW